jgi:hypothetical protein
MYGTGRKHLIDRRISSLVVIIAGHQNKGNRAKSRMASPVVNVGFAGLPLYAVH